MNGERIQTLMGKELREFRASPSTLFPVLILVIITTAVPFLVVTVIPALTGQSLEHDRMMQRVVVLAQLRTPALAGLPPHEAAQTFLFQQFLLMFLVAPIVGAVSLAAYSVIGEKRDRTLEALLTSPLSTAELLIAKVLAAFLPALVLEAAGLVVYGALIAVVAAPGVVGALLTWRSLVLVAGLGPFGALAALQGTIAISSRVNDPRAAQQIAAILVLPLVLLVAGQVSGALYISTGLLLLFTAAAAAVWVVLVMLSVALFERETILTRWPS